MVFSCLFTTVKGQITNQTLTNGNSTTAIIFPTNTGCTYKWTSNNTSIGIAATGIGDIPSFTAVNNTSSPVTATISVTPVQSIYAYVANSVDNTMSIINTITNKVVNTIPVSANPYGVTVSNDYNRVYIANTTPNTLSIINATTFTQEAVITGFLAPYQVAVSPDNQRIYISNSGNNYISELNALTNTITTTFHVGQGPTGLALNFDGSKLYVANYNDGTVSIVNTSTRTVTNTITVDPLPYFCVLSPDNTRLYVVQSNSNEITVINTTNNTVVAHVTVGTNPKGIVVSPDGSRIYVANTGDGTVSVIKTSDLSTIATITVGTLDNGVSLTPDGSALYVTSVISNNVSVINTTTLAVTTTVNVGQKPFSVGSFISTGSTICTGSPFTFTITVNPTPPGPVLTASTAPSAVSTTYGTASAPSTFTVSGGSLTGNLVITAPTGFEVSLDNINYYNVVTINGPGNVGPSTVYIRLKSTTAVGTYSGNIALTSPGATTQNVAMPASRVNPAPLTILIHVTKPYGYGVTQTYIFDSSTNFDFSPINANLKNGELINYIQANFSAGYAANAPVGTYANAVIGSNVAGTNGFVPSNYSITYTPDNLAITPAPITITASSVNKPFGNILTSGPVTSGFSVTGLQNGETITGVTMTYGAGAAANAPPGTYTGSAVASNPVGANGFLNSNYGITYVAGDVDVGIEGPTITATTNPSAVNTVYGTASPSSSFTVSGINMTAGILVTPPAGFEVSTDNINFSNTVTVGAAGNIASTTIYIRLTSTTAASTYAGAIALTSQNATTVNVLMPNSTVTPKPMTITALPVTKPFGSVLPSGQSTTAFQAAGLVNGQSINTIIVNYGPGNAATDPVGTYTGSVIIAASTGGNGFLSTNYAITFIPGDLIVVGEGINIASNPLPLTTVYGTPSASTSFAASADYVNSAITVTPPAGFEVSLDNVTFSNTVTFGNPTLIHIPNTTVYIRLKATTPVGNYGGNLSNLITLSIQNLPPGFVSMPLSTVTLAPLTITANDAAKVYGSTLTAIPGSTAFTATGLQNSETVGSVTIDYGPGAVATANVGVYAFTVTPSRATGGTFSASNYIITYKQGNLSITGSILTVTANDQSRPYGQPNPAFTLTYQGFINGDTAADFITQPVATTTATPSSPIGQYPITVSGGSLLNYYLNRVSGTLTVTTIPGLAVIIPNTFTPNGDGINDTWDITNLNTYSSSTVQIFNRYGTLLFRSVGYPSPWAGTYNGAALPSGTYYYVITLLPGQKPLSGFVAIIR